jgi:acetyl esterase/lipase
MHNGATLRLCLVGLAAASWLVAADHPLTPAAWAARSVSHYIDFTDITYLIAGDYEVKLDIHKRKDAISPQPTVIYIHGGGWIGGSKSGINFLLIPWLEMGWNVVNVEYRLSRVSPAPAAVEDCLCALRWVAAHAQNYGIDVNRLVLSDESAGGHLALTSGLIPEAAGLDRQCPGAPLPKVAAIVNFYGITEVADLLRGPNEKSYAVAWLGSATDRDEVGKRVSPLTYVRPGLPTILTIQGDADSTVPYSHSLRLQDALEKAGVPHQLITVPGGKHGNFTADEYEKIYDEMRAFLAKYNLVSQ